MGTPFSITQSVTSKMKIFIALSALVACGLAAEEAKVVSAPLAYAGYAGYPYAGYPYAGLGYAAGYGYAGLGYPYAAPVAAAAAPVAAPSAVGSQFHAQDEFGNLNYGYANLNSAKQEVGNAYGGVTGGYSYVDAAGKLQQVRYVADGAGFRVEDSRLPVAPVYDGVAPTFSPEALVAPTFNPEPLVAPTFNPELPVAPELTPEVAEATAAHLAAVEAAKAESTEESAERRRRDADAEADPAILAGSTQILTAPTPFIHNAPALPYAGLPYAGLGYAAGYGYAGLGYGAGYGYAGLPYLG